VARRKTKYNCQYCDALLQDHESKAFEELICTKCFTTREEHQDQETLHTPHMTTMMAFSQQMSLLERELDWQSFSNDGVSCDEVAHIVYALIVLSRILGHNHQEFKRYIESLIMIADGVEEVNMDFVNGFEAKVGYSRQLLVYQPNNKTGESDLAT